MFQISLQIVRTCIMVLCINVLHNVPFLREVTSYFERRVKQKLNTESIWTKIQFAENNSVLHCISNLHINKTHFHLMLQFNALSSNTCTVLTKVCYINYQTFRDILDRRQRIWLLNNMIIIKSLQNYIYYKHNILTVL